MTIVTPYSGLSKVISGGQTGADQAGLLAAWRAGLETGGTAPAGFYTDTGNNPLLEVLGLKAEGDYRSRTIKNIRDSNGTVLLSATLDSPGSKLTRNEALRQGKPFIEFDMENAVTAYRLVREGQLTDVTLRDTIRPIYGALYRWIVDNRLGTLNVAGNREKHKQMYTTYATMCVLHEVFDCLRADDLLIRKF